MSIRTPAMPAQASIRDHCAHLSQRLDGPQVGSNKGFNQEPEMCSECYAASSSVLRSHLCEGYADFVPLGASVQPKRVEGGLTWTVNWMGGIAFHLSVQVHPVGSSEPYKNFSEDPGARLAESDAGRVSPDGLAWIDYLHSPR